MKKILLMSAAYLNGGAFVTVGTEVPVGREKLEMTEERADAMVTAKLAEELPDDGEDDADGGDNLDGLKLEELKSIAAAEGVDLGEAKTKAEITAKIVAHRG